MASGATLQTIGDWRNNIKVPLEDAIRVAIEVNGETGEKACRRAVYFMAESASRIAPGGKDGRRTEKSRKAYPNPLFEHLIRKEQYPAVAAQNKDLRRYARYTSARLRQGKPPLALYGNVKKVHAPGSITKINRQKLLSDSWLWTHKTVTGNRRIRGAARFYAISGKGDRGPYMSDGITLGFVIENRMKYVNKAMPANWERRVERRASRRILGAAAREVEKQWKSKVTKERRVGRALGRALLGR